MSKSNYHINGIQQIGIGNTDVYRIFQWYRDHLDMKTIVFDEAAEAALMLPYTMNQVRSRHAILALNLHGGGGAEIWQYTSRVAQKPGFDIRFGDCGIQAAQYKIADAEEMHKRFVHLEPSPIFTNSNQQRHFYLRDTDDNLIDLVEYTDWFQRPKAKSGGVCGAMICVSDMDKSLAFYKDILLYDTICSDMTGSFEDLQYLASDQKNVVFRRVMLTHSDKKNGAFSGLFGKTQIELVQRLFFESKTIFQDRMWGDMGYIHLCFDVNNMASLREYCQSKDHPLTVDSGDFDMGEAAGHFAYIEDPDGTLIEFVETHKVPIIKKLNWYLNLKNRTKRRHLPRWMIKAMGW